MKHLLKTKLDQELRVRFISGIKTWNMEQGYVYEI